MSQGRAAENHYELTGLEANIVGLRHARLRLPSVEFVQADARNLPYESTFDAVGAFNVIEHIVEDDAVLVSIRHALKPGGIFIGPAAYVSLELADAQALHKRSYTRRQLSAKLRTAGFDILRCSSFVTMLCRSCTLRGSQSGAVRWGIPQQTAMNWRYLAWQHIVSCRHAGR